MASGFITSRVAQGELYSAQTDPRTAGPDTLPQDTGAGTQRKRVNRLQKLLEGATIKLAAVATDVLGKSGRDMLEAVMGGEQDAEALAALARGRLRAKLPDLRLALEGRVQPHHRFLLHRILAHIDFLEQSIAQVEQEIAQHLRPFEEAMDLVQSITGLQATTAGGILAEIGADMTRFPSEKHLARLSRGLSG